MIPSFNWRSKWSDDMGVVLTAFPDIVRPKERVSTVTITGRSGSLTVVEDEDAPVYEQFLMTLKCYLRPEGDPSKVLAWLTNDPVSNGKLILNNDPDYYYVGRIINQISMSRIMAGRDYFDFSVGVQCEPFKRLVDEEVYDTDTSVNGTTALTSGLSIKNPSGIIARPTIDILGTGTVKLTLGNTVTIKNLTTAEGVRIDADTGIISSASPESASQIKYGNKASLVSGELPYIGTSKQTISWSGNVTRVVVRPNWRFM